MNRWIALAAAVLALAGCSGAPRGGGAAQVRAPLPGYTEVAQRFNERAGPLDRLWARTVVRAWFTDRDGKPHEEQFEGHFQYLRADRLLLTFDKVGNTYAALGSNQESYWWIERQQGGGAEAWVGDHAKATPGRIEQLGLPVHPLSFIDVLGITPLPEAEAPVGDFPPPTVAWSEDGQSLLVTAPGRLGERRLWLDPQTFLPSRIDLFDASGAVALSATLSKYIPLAIRTPVPDWSPGVPSVIEATRESGGLRVRMDLFDPETAGSRPKAAAFDLPTLLKSFGVGLVHSLDQPAPEKAAAPPAPPAAPAGRP